MDLNPYAPLYYPSTPPASLPPPPPPPPLPQIRTCICFFPPRPPFPFHHPFAGKSLPATRPKAKIERRVWLPRESSKDHGKFLSAAPVAPPLHATVSTNLEFLSAPPELLMKGTTIMIKNIPNKMTEMLIEMLDQHCAEQQKRLGEVHEEKNFVKSEYDFVYLPIDFRTRANKGYAFVNFTTVEAAKNSNKEMHHHKWVIFSSKKVARVCFARVQGKTALVYRFKCTQFRCDTDEFLPATFTPPRNGTTSLPPPDTVGKRIIHFH